MTPNYEATEDKEKAQIVDASDEVEEKLTEKDRKGSWRILRMSELKGPIAFWKGVWEGMTVQYMVSMLQMKFGSFIRGPRQLQNI